MKYAKPPQDPNAQNESDVSFDTRLKNSVAHGEASQERPTTMAVKEEEKKLKAAWMKYEEPPHTAQPMVAQCSAILQGARSEFAKSHCSLEFHETLEQQAAQVNAAYITYEKMDSSYASFANEVKLEGLVLYDLYTVAGCK